MKTITIEVGDGVLRLPLQVHLAVVVLDEHEKGTEI